MYDYAEDGDAAAVWAQWALLQPNLRIVDTETTDLYDAEVIEVAVIDGQGETLLHRRVRPVHRIAYDATEVHGLTADLLRDAPDFRVIYPDLRRVLDGGYVVIYNADFDTPILNRSADLWSLPAFPMQPYCAMLAYAAYYGDWSDYHGNYKWQKLTAAAARFGISTREAHGALADARMTLGVLQGMAGYVKRPSRRF